MLTCASSPGFTGPAGYVAFDRNLVLLAESLVEDLGEPLDRVITVHHPDKSAVGVLFLPVLVECLLWRGALAVLSSAAEILNTGGQAVIFKSLNSVCAMLMALLICILILFVISTVIILLVGT